MKKSPLKRGKRTPRQKWIETLDILWRIAIRSRDGGVCQLTGKPGREAHHIFTREDFSTRWNPDNGIYLHAGHQYGDAHKRPEKFRDWLIAEWFDGEDEYYSLKRKAFTERYHGNYELTQWELVEFIKKQKKVLLNSKKEIKLWLKLEGK